MKKLLIFIGIVALCSCTCQVAISQVPPQNIFVDANCQAVLPDYTTDEYIVVTDNCGIKSVVQTPAPGYVLSAVDQTVTVVIRATDNFENFFEISFPVTAKDSVAPVITPTGKFLADNWDVIDTMYDRAELLLAEQEAFFDANFDWEAAGIPEDKRPTGQYDTKVLSVMSSPGHAKTGYGGRTYLFKSNNDEFIVK